MTDSAISPDAARKPTDVDRLAERFLDAQADLDPIMATYIGLPGHDAEMPDLSPAGLEASAALVRSTLGELAGARPTDDVDKVTIAAMTERLQVSAELYDLGAYHSELNNIASSVQALRDVFDLMPTDTAANWFTVATRLSRIPAAVDGYIASLRLAAARGDVAPQRQVKVCVGQCEKNLGAEGFFAQYSHGATVNGSELPDTLRADLDRASHAAQAGYQTLRDFLADELLPQAPESDGCGVDNYRLYSRNFLGATVDLHESYAWGQQELARITKLMLATADEIKSGSSVSEAMDFLDADTARQLAGTGALQAWMQSTADAAIEALADTHFDIPAPIRTLECKIAPTNTGGIYYTGPSDDFSRPGRMWWSVPAGVTGFSTWRERTTVYHEGVPGHHLQVAQTVFRKQLLNKWRRLASWTSGHGEGWALYAEWLMADLGYMDDPGDRLGLLDAQSLRAARVVIDIGVHCGFPAPAEVGGGEWTYDKAWQFLTSHSNMPEAILRFELDRYLGWPGQAPSYKLGERRWLQLRDETRAREGESFNLKAFHRRALDVGSVGLDVLRKAVLDEL
jgi:uncharacterized protein (DUF885 family)